MVNALKTKEQVTRYNRYVGLNNWISINQPIAMNMYQRADSEISKIVSLLTTAHAAEETYRYMERLPAIFTQKQYDEIKAARIEAALQDGRTFGVFQLIAMALSYFLRQLEDEPRKATPLKAIRRQYRQGPLDSPYILARYNAVMEEGDYTLADGRRSDEMTEEAWQEAITSPQMEQDLQEIQARDGFAQGAALDLAIERLVSRSNIIMAGGTQQDAAAALEEQDIASGYTVPLTWHSYAAPPEDLTKWDIIASGDLDLFYSASLADTAQTPEACAQEANDFMASFPTLAQTLLSEIDRRYCKGEEGIAGLPVEAWQATTFGDRTLYDKDFFGFRAILESDAALFADNSRARLNGIAILHPGDDSPRIHPETGDYEDPKATKGKHLSSIGLDQFTPANEHHLQHREALARSYEGILDAYYYVLGFDKAVDMIASHIDIPDFAIFKLSSDILKGRMDAAWGLVAILYAQIHGTRYANAAAKAQKLEALKACFSPLDLGGLCIPKEAIAQAQGMLDDNLRAFEAQDGSLPGRSASAGRRCDHAGQAKENACHDHTAPSCRWPGAKHLQHHPPGHGHKQADQGQGKSRGEHHH